eukprot:scaffold58873_cov21-Tisochrysis_lutea.AAC.1
MIDSFTCTDKACTASILAQGNYLDRSDPSGSDLQGSQRVFQVGDRVYVRPGKAQQQQQQQHQQQHQQQQGVLWQAASVVSVSGADSEVVVMYEQ